VGHTTYYTEGNEMPNWCYQQMRVVGNSKNLKKFRDDMKVTEVREVKNENDTKELSNVITPTLTTVIYDSLNHFFPTPKDLQDTVAGSMKEGSPEALKLAKQEVSNMEKYGHKNWYEWNCENWGSKWGACDVTVTELWSKELNIYFESAWSPAGGLIENISGQYPELIFSISFTEESCAFAGWAIFHKGLTVHEGAVPTDLSPKLNRLYEEIGLLSDDDTTKDEKYQEFYELSDEYRSRMVEIGDEDLDAKMKVLMKQIKKVSK